MNVLKDYNLVKNVYGTTATSMVGGSSSTRYWIASRRYYVTSGSDRAGFVGRTISGDSVSSMYYMRYYDSAGPTYWSDTTRSYPVRPIITLNNNIKTNTCKNAIFILL